MSSKRVIVELSPSRLQVAVVRAGTVISTRLQRFARTDWPEQFGEAIKALHEPLTRMVEELGCAHSHASVVYLAPGAVSNVTSCPATAGTSSAEMAARLALANVADFVLDGSPSDTMILLTEHSGGNGPAFVPQTHVLAAADSEPRAAAVTECVKAAGLTIERLFPIEALALSQSVRLVTQPGTDGLKAVLWLGDHSSALAVGSAGRLIFVRTVSAGTESLVEALTRPIRPTDLDGEPVTLTRDQARRLLTTIGIPVADQTLADFPSLAGSSLLPHLQPVLQRLAIEIKQSLRFGIPEAQRGKVGLSIAGPGSAINNLADVLARQAGVPVALPGPSADAAEPAVEAVLAHDPISINLLPEQLRNAALSRRLRGALFAGAAIALGTLGIDYASTFFSLRQDTARLAVLQAKHDSLVQSVLSRESSLAARVALSSLEQRIRARLVDCPDASSALSLLAQETPASVRLTDASLGSETNSHSLVLRGYIRYADVSDPASVINRYIASLSSIPVVASARLGSAVRAPMRGSDSQSFEIRLEMVPLPPSAATAFVRQSTEDR